MMTTFLMYTDESGNEAFTVNSSILVPIERWPTVLGAWLRYRRYLAKQGVPKNYHLHMFEWIKAKDRPRPDLAEVAPINSSEPLRRDLTLKAVKTIASLADSGVEVFTTRHESPKQHEAYAAHVNQLDAHLQRVNDWGIAVVDAPFTVKEPQSSARSTFDTQVDDQLPSSIKVSPELQRKIRVHRELALDTRHLIEDSWIQPAAGSQLVQMADIVAHCAYQGHAVDSKRQFMWLLPRTGTIERVLLLTLRMEKGPPA